MKLVVRVGIDPTTSRFSGALDTVRWGSWASVNVEFPGLLPFNCP
jgi:hypothetical protein